MIAQEMSDTTNRGKGGLGVGFIEGRTLIEGGNPEASGPHRSESAHFCRRPHEAESRN